MLEIDLSKVPIPQRVAGLMFLQMLSLINLVIHETGNCPHCQRRQQ